MAKTYKPKKKKVNAIQWNGENVDDVRLFIEKGTAVKRGRSMHIQTPQSAILLNDKDWLVQEEDKSLSTMNDKAFKDKYQEVEEK